MDSFVYTSREGLPNERVSVKLSSMKDNNQRASVALLLTLADTTWRMVVPTVLTVALGLFLDLKFGTKPWLTLLGLLVGFGLAGLLIKRQLEKIQ